MNSVLVALASTANSGCQSRQCPDLEVSQAIAHHFPLEMMAGPFWGLLKLDFHRNNIRNNPTWRARWTAGSDRCLKVSLLVLETVDTTS